MHKDDIEMNGSSSNNSAKFASSRVHEYSKELENGSEKNKNQDVLQDTEGFHRYSRSKLFALRNLKRSQDRPPYRLRNDLQVLGVWKSISSIDTSCKEDPSSCYQMDEYAQEKEAMAEAGQSMGVNKRTIRSRERLVNYYRDKEVTKTGGGMDQGQNAPSPSSHNVLAQGGVHKSILMDQRSASSSHLLPAFAKRQMATTNQVEPSSMGNTSNMASTKNSAQNPENSSPQPNRLLNKHSDQMKDRNYSRQADDLSPHGRASYEHSADFMDRVPLNNQESMGYYAGNPRHGNAAYERRFGSGRLLPRDINWDYRTQGGDKEKHYERDMPSSAQQKNVSRINERIPPNRNANARYIDKRNFNRRPMRREYEKGEKNQNESEEESGLYHNSDSNHYRRGNPRFMKHNHRDDRNDEPEWFSEGPKSQHDTIELRGFEENVNGDTNEHDARSECGETQKNESEGEDLRNDENSNTNSENGNENRQIIDEDDRSSVSETLEKNLSPRGGEGVSAEKSRNRDNLSSPGSNEFNFDAFLNFDSLNNTIMQLDPDDSSNASLTSGSRFSRLFFKNDGNENASEQESASGDHPENELLKRGDQLNPLSEFLLNSGAQQVAIRAANLNKPEILSVAELEAKMRKSNVTDTPKDIQLPRSVESPGASFQQPENNNHPDQGKHSPREDMEAFKKLLLQAQSNTFPSEPGRLPQNKPQAMDGDKPLLNMRPENFQKPCTDSPPVGIFPNFANVEPRIRQPPPFFPMRDAVIPPQILHAEQQRQNEFFKLMQSVHSGEISVGFLQNQLIHPNMPPHVRELIFAVLREHSIRSGMLANAPDAHPALPHAMQLKQLPMQPTPQQHLLLQIPPNLQLGQQHEAASSKGVNIEAMPAHHHGAMTPNSFQQLKHLNENAPQQTNQHSNRHMPSPTPTPLAFTPTSVLRKMTAEKDTNAGNHAEMNTALETFVNKHQQQFQQPNTMESSPRPPTPSHHLPRMILGGGPPSNIVGNQFPPLNSNVPQQQPLAPHLRPLPQRWPMGGVNQNVFVNKPLGRPILKGPSPMAQQQPAPFPGMPHGIFQQGDQQKLKVNGGNPIFMNMPPLPHNQQQQSQPINLMQQQQQQQQQPHQMMGLPNHQLEIQLQEKQFHCMDPHMRNNLNAIHDIEGDSGGIAEMSPFPRNTNLSPTSNQLAQWFSPELLAQATAGKLPSLNLNQALSLEEFEKQQHSSTTVQS